MLPAGLPQNICHHGLTGTAAGIQAMQLPLPKNHDEGVAAQSIHHRLGDITHRCHRDSGVNCVATFLENLQANLGHERLA
jgi:hypothetical protein